jgi:hypothetical protein
VSPRAVSAAAFLLASALSFTAAAQAPRPRPADDRTVVLARERSNFFLVGVGVEHFGNTIKSFGRGQDILLGPTLAWRIASVFEPHLEVMITPFSGPIENLRLLGTLGARTYWRVPKLTEISVGWAIHAEARLQDHYWLASLTPIELGATLYRKGSLRIQLFTGFRAGFGGALIDSFLLDPNGFQDQDARQALEDARLHSPWKLFVRFVFERRVN